MTARTAKWISRIGGGMVGVGLAVAGWTLFAPALSPQAPAAATTRPAARVSPEASQLLAQVTSAYSSLKGLTVKGTVHADFDIDGQKKTDDHTLTAYYGSGGLFRVEMSDNAIVANTGKSIFSLDVPDNVYRVVDTPKDAVNFKTLDSDLADLVLQLNPSVGLAVSGDASAALLDGAVTADKSADLTIDNVSYQTLIITYPSRDATIALDAKTHLIHQEIVDLAKLAKERGAKLVTRATETFDFATTTPDIADPAVFAWAPPADSRKSDDVAQTGDVPALAGKPAPTFTLTSLDGTKINSADLKGSVYLLDFWATWCGPCVELLPETDKTYQDLKGSGFKAFAVDLQEDKPTVSKFIQDKKISLPVLLDSDGAVGKAYGAVAIPETVVVGKDGVVRKVFVGSGQESAIRDEITAAMK